MSLFKPVHGWSTLPDGNSDKSGSRYASRTINRSRPSTPYLSWYGIKVIVCGLNGYLVVQFPLLDREGIFVPFDESTNMEAFRPPRQKCPFCQKALPAAILLKLFRGRWGATANCPSPGCSTIIKVVRGKSGHKDLLFQRVDLSG